MARTPGLAAASSTLPRSVSDRLVPLSVIAASGLGLVAYLLTVTSREPRLPAVVLGVAAVVVAVFGVPVRITRGAALLVAVCTSAVLGPTSAPGRIILFGIGLSCLALGLALVRGWSSGDRHSPKLQATSVVGSGAYLGLLVIASIVGQGAGESLWVTMSIALPIILAVLVGRHFTVNDLQAFARGLASFAVVQVLVGTVDLFVRPLPFLGYSSFSDLDRLPNPFSGDRFPRAQAMLGHPIILALLVAVALELIATNRVRLSRPLRAVLLLLLSWGLLISGTRSAVLALALASVYLALTAPSVGRRIRNGLLIASGAVIMAIVPATAGYVRGVLDDLSESGSYTHRAGAWESVPGLIANRPAVELLLGSGPGSEQALFHAGVLQRDGLYVVDNQFVTTLITGGLLGLGLLLTLLARVLVYGCPAVKVMMITLVVMFNAFDLLRWPAPAMLVFLCLGLVDNENFRHLSRRPIPARSPSSGGPQVQLPAPAPALSPLTASEPQGATP